MLHEEQNEQLNELFDNLFKSVNNDLFVMKNTIHDAQIDTLLNQTKLNIDTLKQKLLNIEIK
jgi:hypothetical protein